MPPSHRIVKTSKFNSNHSSLGSSGRLVLQRQDSIHSERRREIKHSRKASYFTKAQKIQEGLLSDDDSIESYDMRSPPQHTFMDPMERNNMLSDDAAFFTDDFVLDTNQELPIRKPQSAYVIFGKMKRDMIMRQNPGIKVTEVVKQIAKLWQSLSKEEKQRYKELAKQDKERYVKELRDLTRCNKTLDKPKKPLTPYMLFVRETRPKVVRDNPNIPALDIMKEVGRIWQNITKEELDYFKEKSKKDMDRYKREHERFINEINDLRAKYKPDKNDMAFKEFENEFKHLHQLHQPLQEEPAMSSMIMPNTKQSLPSSQQSQLSMGSVADNNKEVGFLTKRHKPEEFEMTSKASLMQGTPLKSGKIYSHYSQQETPSTNNDEPMSPYMRAKREMSRPKKPLSAYIYFSQEYREKLKEQHPEWSSNEIMRHVSSKWSHMDKKQKEPYNQMALHDKARYDKQLVDFAQATENQNHPFDIKRHRKSSDSYDYQQIDLKNGNNEYQLHRESSSFKDNHGFNHPQNQDEQYQPAYHSAQPYNKYSQHPQQANIQNPLEREQQTPQNLPNQHNYFQSPIGGSASYFTANNLCEVAFQGSTGKQNSFLLQSPLMKPMFQELDFGAAVSHRKLFEDEQDFLAMPPTAQSSAARNDNQYSNYYNAYLPEEQPQFQSPNTDYFKKQQPSASSQQAVGPQVQNYLGENDELFDNFSSIKGNPSNYQLSFR